MTALVENALQTQVVDIDMKTNALRQFHRKWILDDSRATGEAKVVMNRIGGMASLICTPREEPLIGNMDLPYYRYVCSMLWFRPTRRWEPALECVSSVGTSETDAHSALGHGAQKAILARLPDTGVTIPAGIRVIDLTTEHIVAITRALIAWPFHPDPVLEAPTSSELKRTAQRDDDED